MGDRSITMAILGIIVVTAIVGLVFMFSMAKTGAGIYANWDYEKQQPMNPEPYARQIYKSPTVQYPAAYGMAAGQPVEPPRYGGGNEFFISGTEQGTQKTLKDYERGRESNPSFYTTGIGIELNGIRLTQCYGDRLYLAKAARADGDPKMVCSTVGDDGPVEKKLPQYFGCCNR